MSKLYGQHHSLAGAILRGAPLLHREFWPEWRLRHPNKAVFGFWQALSDTLRTYVPATYFVTVSLGTPLALTPERIIIDGSQTNREAILSCDTTDRLQDRSRRRLKPIRIRQSGYLNNRIEQDHRAVKRRVRPMLGFKSLATARVVLGGIELVHMMRKGQAKYARNSTLSLAGQFELLAT